ncbi:peptidoglycan-binding domain-containing protein [Tautonia plasticadhaerens]|uniref:peptidoglycan-binding domain-containing protein n=1 Tax=Tautonia plasticadhaerens TaxID=2527974 RepID=UPI0018D242BB|nr:peptidoglycan-binding protein [Tautonia plasticadhaerens]
MSDPAHVVPGATGTHVVKIQQALIRLDDADIDPDGVYGPATAAAVLAYKQVRSIINPAHQTRADNIVGKMTMASLDREILQQEAIPRPRVQIKPTSFSRVRPPRPLPLVALLDRSRSFGVNGATVAAPGSATGSAIVAAPVIRPGPDFGPRVVLELRRNSVGSFEVTNGMFGEVSIADTGIAKIAPDAPVVPGEKAPVVQDPQTFKVFSGKALGRTTITASTLAFTDGGSASIEVVVKTFATAPRFVQGINHAHRPSGRYADVQANPNSGFLLELACKVHSAQGLVDLAKRTQFQDKPIALKHLNFYLTDGKGADFVEDANIKDWLTRDRGIKKRLKREIFPGPGRKPRGEGHFTFEQDEFADDAAGQDFRFAFGGIDRVDFEVDFSQDTVRVFFQDRYEWHPVYPFYSFVGPTAQFPESGDEVRETNCLHAALVELKASGAADFWMKGQAEVALSSIIAP